MPGASVEAATINNAVSQRPEQRADTLRGLALSAGTGWAQLVERSSDVRQEVAALQDLRRGDLGTMEVLVERDEQHTDRLAVDVGTLSQLGAADERIREP